MVELIDELDAFKKAEDLRAEDFQDGFTMYVIIANDTFHIAVPINEKEKHDDNDYFAAMIKEVRGGTSKFSQLFSDEVHNFFRVVIKTSVSCLQHEKNIDPQDKSKPLERFNTLKSSFAFFSASDSKVSPFEVASYHKFMEHFNYFFINTESSITLNGSDVTRLELDNELAMSIDPRRDKPLVLNYGTPQTMTMKFGSSENKPQNS